MSEHSSTSQQKGPSKHGLSWIYFAIAFTFVAGTAYAIFYHGFLGATNATTYRESVGMSVVAVTEDFIPERTPQAIANGAASYKTCAACHGANLEGLACTNLDDNEWLHFKEPKETNLAKLIKGGVPAGATKGPKGGAMPPMGTLDNMTKVWEVIYYLQTKNPNIIKDSVPTKK